MNDYIRDEIALTIHGVAVGGQLDPGCTVCEDALRRADALMPIIERVNREAAAEGIRLAHKAVRGFQIGDEIDRAIRAATPKEDDR